MLCLRFVMSFSDKTYLQNLSPKPLFCHFSFFPNKPCNPHCSCLGKKPVMNSTVVWGTKRFLFHYFFLMLSIRTHPSLFFPWTSIIDPTGGTALCAPAAMKPSSKAAGAHLLLTPPETRMFFRFFATSLPLYGSHPSLCFLSSHEIYLSISVSLFFYLTAKLMNYVFFIIILTLFLSQWSENLKKKKSRDFYLFTQTLHKIFKITCFFRKFIMCWACKEWRDQVLGSYLLSLHPVTNRMPECHEPWDFICANHLQQFKDFYSQNYVVKYRRSVSISERIYWGTNQTYWLVRYYTVCGCAENWV